MEPKTYVTIDDFCIRIGMSRTRLYRLFQKRAGPPRHVLQTGTLATRVLIPLEEGLAWEAERQRHIHPSNKRVAVEERERAARRRSRRVAALQRVNQRWQFQN